jgi:hypothetical protein
MSDRVNEAITAVAQFLIADAPLGKTLDLIAALAQEAIAPATAVGVTLMHHDGRPTTAVFTDQVSPRVDQAQYDDGVGPCLDAFREGCVIRVDDTRLVGPRWPRFSKEAVDAGVLSTLSLPLSAASDTFGVFNVYARNPQAFSPTDEVDTSRFVTQAAVVLANARAYWHVFELADGLRTAMETRAEIEQAKGVIMATSGCSAAEAFELLRAQSQRENRKLREIAQEIALRQKR